MHATGALARAANNGQSYSLEGESLRR